MALFSEMMDEQAEIDSRIAALKDENLKLWGILADCAELLADLTEPKPAQGSMHLWARAIELRTQVASLKTR